MVDGGNGAGTEEIDSVARMFASAGETERGRCTARKKGHVADIHEHEGKVQGMRLFDKDALATGRSAAYSV